MCRHDTGWPFEVDSVWSGLTTKQLKNILLKKVRYKQLECKINEKAANAFKKTFNISRKPGERLLKTTLKNLQKNPAP